MENREPRGEFSGMAAIVSGGGSGIGEAIARELVGRGAKVCALDLDPSKAPDGVFRLRGDVTNDASVRSAVAEVVQTWGRLDIVVNNAGVGAAGTVEDNPDDEWCRVFDVNVMGMVRLTRASLPHLRRSLSPAVVNVASVAATTGLPMRALYSATKGAVQSLTLAMAADYVREGIRVNCVNPGTALTPWVERLLRDSADPDTERTALNDRQPHGRLVNPEEVASAVAYLAGPASGSTVGAVLAVDGGMSSVRLRSATSG